MRSNATAGETTRYAYVIFHIVASLVEKWTMKILFVEFDKLYEDSSTQNFSVPDFIKYILWFINGTKSTLNGLIYLRKWNTAQYEHCCNVNIANEVALISFGLKWRNKECHNKVNRSNYDMNAYMYESGKLLSVNKKFL